MSDMEISQVLAQMRVMAAKAQGMDAPTETDAASNFQDLLKKSINAVNDTQKAAGALTEKFQQGDPNTDITDVMIALQKSSVSFHAMTQVRNKIMDAYQEIMRMQV